MGQPNGERISIVHSNMDAPDKPTRPDPDFDGHLEKPLTEMTPSEKLDWLWEMLCLQRMAQQAVKKPREGGGPREGE